MCISGGAPGGVGQSGLELLSAGLAALAGADVVGLPDAAVRAELLGLVSALNSVQGLLAERVASFDTRQLGEADGMRNSQSWLRAFGRMSGATASALLSRARLLRVLPQLAAGAVAGQVSAESVGQVAGLAAQVGVEAVADFDEVLATLAAAAGPGEVAVACRRIEAHVDPDGAEPDPVRDFDRRELTLYRWGEMLGLRGRLDPEGGAVVRTALDALLRPPARDDERTPAQRCADALVELARLPLAAGALATVGGQRPHIGVLLTPQTLLHFDDPPHDDPPHDFAPHGVAPEDLVSGV